MKIHYSEYADMKDIKIFCTQKWTWAGWSQPADLPIGVYASDEPNLYYTFEKSNMTCDDCKNLIDVKNIIK